MRTYFNSPKAPSFLIFLVLSLIAARLAAADPIPLRWDANPEPQVTGYVMHVGNLPGTYTQHIDVGLTTTYVYMSAIAGQRKCFAVSAYVPGPFEGPKSNEVCGYSDAPPTLVNPGTQTASTTLATTLQLQGADPEGQPVTYSATGLPPGLVLTASTGFISGTPIAASSHTVTATVSDGVLVASQTFTWTIVVPDTTPPSVTITGPTSAAAYTTATAVVTVSGTGSDNVGVTQVSWVSDRGGSGTASGTAIWTSGQMTVQSGENVITITARDAANNSATDAVTITYSPNVAPALGAVVNPSTAIGEAATLQLAGTDADGDTLTYSATGLPQGLTLVAATGVVSGTPGAAGASTVTATVSDGALFASRTFVWTVTPDVTAPTIAITAPTAAATFAASAATMTLSGVASDSLGVVTVSWTNNRGGTGTAIGTIVWTTAAVALQSGVNIITMTAHDAAGNTATAVLTVTVNATPVLASVVDPSTAIGEAATLQLAGTDADGDTLTYSATGLPQGLTLVAATGVISGTPDVAGVSTVTATASDGVLSASRTFTWTVTADATAPTIAITAPTAAATFAASAATVTLSGVASDSLGVVTVSWTNNRGGTGTAIGTIVWTTAAVALQSGVNIITMTAHDAAGNTATAVLTVTVNATPVLASVVDPSTAIGEAATLQLAGTDADGDTLTYSATGLPQGLTLVAATGVISGTPGVAGVSTVTATVSDGVLSASRTFTWTVTADVTAPTIAITAPTAAATFAASAPTMTLSGVASDSLGVVTVSWTNNRGGTGTAIGTIVWTTAAVALQSGVNIITMTAHDAAGNTASAVLTVTVNVAPALGAVVDPSTGIGQAATLQLAGTDADGDTLTYSATGLPQGLTLVAATGVISGTPGVAGVSTVTATVSDGVLSASRTFTWTVTADVTAPTIAITGPTTAATYSTTLTTAVVSGTAGDALGVTQVSWTNSRGGSGTAVGTTNWTTAAIALQSGVNILTMTARDAAGNTASAVLTVTVNRAPVLGSVANRSTGIGQAATLQLVGTDADGNALTYSATGLPQGLTLVAATGVISGTPSVAGVSTVTATVSDGVLSASRTFTWTVTADVTAPTIAITGPTTAATYSTTLTTAVVSGTAGDALGVTQVSWTNSRGGSGTAVGTTNWATAVIALQSGANVITVTARDAAGNAKTDVLTISATAPPTIAITAPTSSGTYLTNAATVTIRGTAADDSRITRVTWVNNRGGSGTASGTTDWSMVAVALQAGANVFTITARDTVGDTVTAVITVTRNVAPTLASVSNRTTRIGQTVSLQLVGGDVNGDVLVYGATSLPPGLSLVPSTGRITGSPTTRGNYSVTVSVSDGALSASRSFTWTIN